MDELMRKIRDKPENAQNPLILQTKFYDVMVYSHKALLQCPKAEKYQLVANIKESEKECMHHIIDLEKKYTKKDDAPAHRHRARVSAMPHPHRV